MSMPIYSRSVWGAQPQQLAATDKITVRNLQTTVDAGVDVWGRVKTQRALITVTLSLAKPFQSAAETDIVDNSTVHYGKLSKDIQACIQEINGKSDVDEHGRRLPKTSNLMNAILNQIRYKTVGDDSLLASYEVEIFYPKGSMLGDGVGYTVGQSIATPDFYSQLYLRNVRVPCLIGVNANERLQKQPVVINVWIDPVSAMRSEDYPQLESAIVEVVSNSSFETLESLTTTIVQRIRDDFAPKLVKGVPEAIRLRIEKPHAVPAADAPSIEIYRSLR